MAYIQNPVTVIKDGEIVKDVYLSDLPSWLANGYVIHSSDATKLEPILEPTKAKSKPKPVVEP